MEDKQRHAKKAREAKGIMEEAPPVYFNEKKDPEGNTVYEFNGKYWSDRDGQQWGGCPDIY
jgi:hypothetical protein